MYSVCQQQCSVYINNMVQSVANINHRQGLRSSTCPTFVVPGQRKLQDWTLQDWTLMDQIMRVYIAGLGIVGLDFGCG